MRLLKLVGVLVMALAVPGTADAAQRYAEPGGDGAEPCLQADPCDIQKAVEGSGPGTIANGDEVILASGDYSVGADMVQVTVDMDVHGTRQSSLPRILSSAPYGLYVGNAGAMVSDLAIVHTGTAGGLFLNPGNAERLYVSSTVAVGPACLPGEGLLRDSVCWNRTDPSVNGVGVGFNFSGGAHPVKLRNVTAVSDHGYGMAFATSTGGDTDVDAKSVIAQGATFDVRGAQDTAGGATNDIVLANSNYDSVDPSSSGAVTPAGTGTNETTPPVFVAGSSGDFRQDETSVGTINQGAADAFSGMFDLDGQPRTMGTAPDIGAIEFFEDPPPPPPPPPPPDDPDPPAGNPDTDPPETTIGKSPKRKTEKRKAKVGFSSDEAGAIFECSLDGKAFSACAPPFKKRVKVGKHRFQVRAIDAVGNVDPTPAKVRWKVLEDE